MTDLRLTNPDGSLAPPWAGTPTKAVIEVRWPLWLAALLALASIRMGPFIGDVWRTGVFNDTDDALRMVQVRAWLAGQGWYDLTAHGIGPGGLPMHWTRVVDVPLALLLKLFAPLGPALAETITRLVFPAMMLVLLFWIVGRAAGLLAGREARYPAAALVIGSAALAQYLPGRVDHHGPQIVLLVGFVAATLAAMRLPPARAWRPAALGAGALVVSLAIGLENLPFFAVGLAALALDWAVRGPAARGGLVGTALGLAVGLPVALVFTTAPSDWGRTVCDSYSSVFLVLGLAGAGLFGLCAALEDRLGRPAARLALLAAGALCLGGIVLLAYPSCLHDPLRSADPLLDLWMKNVAEARPLPLVLAQDPDLALAFLVPNALAILGCLWRARRGPDRAQSAWLLGAALLAVGLAASCWQMRVSTSTSALVVVFGTALVLDFSRSFADATRFVSRTLWPIVIGLVFVQAPWLLAAQAAMAVVDGSANVGSPKAACIRPADFTGLGELPPAQLFNTIDLGSYILATTHHRVLAAAYHRNIAANTGAISVFTGPTDRALEILRSSGARYLVTCPHGGEMSLYAHEYPDGFAARLERGEVPPGLRRMEASGPLAIFEIKPAAQP